MIQGFIYEIIVIDKKVIVRTHDAVLIYTGLDQKSDRMLEFSEKISNVAAHAYSFKHQLLIIGSQDGEIRVNDDNMNSLMDSNERNFTDYNMLQKMKNMRGMITTMTLDENEEFLLVGTKKGWIVAYALADIISGKSISLFQIEGQKIEIKQIIVRDRQFDMQVITINAEGLIKIMTLPIKKNGILGNVYGTDLVKSVESLQMRKSLSISD